MTSVSPDVISRSLNPVLSHASTTMASLGAAAAQPFYQIFRKDVEQTKANIRELADSGRIIEIIAALSVLSGLPIDLIDRLMCDEVASGAMVLCKAIDLDWSVTHAVLSMGPSASAQVSQVEEICDDFERLSVASAQRLMSYWQGRLSVQVA